MSTLAVSYHDLEDAAKDARKAAALLEEYGETIEEKLWQIILKLLRTIVSQPIIM